MKAIAPNGANGVHGVIVTANVAVAFNIVVASVKSLAEDHSMTLPNVLVRIEKVNRAINTHVRLNARYAIGKRGWRFHLGGNV